MVKLHLENIQS